jgi:hypothetical protein
MDTSLEQPRTRVRMVISVQISIVYSLGGRTTSVRYLIHGSDLRLIGVCASESLVTESGAFELEIAEKHNRSN